MAATPHGLVLLTRCGRLATLRDGALVLGAFVGDATLAVAPAPGPPPAVWLYGGALDEALTLHFLDGDAGRERYHGVPPTAIALSGAGAALIASGLRVERVQRGSEAGESWSTAAVVTLPDGEPDIVGLLDLDGHLLFATRECVYELRGDLVLPLVAGIGGPLVSWRGAVVVLDARTGRLFRLSGPALTTLKDGAR
jgi:hypothetical protein